MIKRAVKSFGHACDGFLHALTREPNFRHFFAVYFIIVLPVSSLLFTLMRWETVSLFLAGGMFLSIELLNTALERLTDAVDELRGENAKGFHQGLKATKDVAAAASLVSLVTVIAVMILVLGPHILSPM